MEAAKDKGVRRPLSEESSEKPRGRGRPRLLTPTDEAFHRSLAPGRSSRTYQEHFFLGRAVAVLGIENDGLAEPYQWLLGKGTILSELGRIEDDDFLRFVASEICRSQPTAREARERIRWVRTRRFTNGSTEGLAGALRTALNRYLAGHRNVRLESAEDALARILDEVREARSRNPTTARPPREAG
ncbi:MAG: hypothetical protein ACYC4P_07180 [Thermoanaerobaculia bacterium]